MRAGPEADEVAAPQLVERAQEMLLIGQPSLVLHDDGGAVAVGADAERIAPLTAPADIDGARWPTDLVLVENPEHWLDS
jgi:hypothetical protein